MGKFAKWIGGGLGWAFFGPIGGLMGFLLGTVVDSTQVITGRIEGPTTPGDFAASLLVLTAAVMKADNKILRSELDYVKAHFIRNFGTEAASEALIMLRNILQQTIPVQQVCQQIQQHLDYASRLQLLHFLYGIAAADGHVHPLEIEKVQQIAGYLGISQADIQSVSAMFIPNTDWAYKVLEIEPSASDDEVKKAYRKMAMVHHPDKVAYLGEDIKKAANEKFQKINEAYETILKERKK